MAARFFWSRPLLEMAQFALCDNRVGTGFAVAMRTRARADKENGLARGEDGVFWGTELYTRLL